MLGTGLSNIMPPSMKYSEAYAVSCNSIQSEKIYFFLLFSFSYFLIEKKMILNQVEGKVEFMKPTWMDGIGLRQW